MLNTIIGQKSCVDLLAHLASGKRLGNILVVGPPGMGKTNLVKHFASEARASLIYANAFAIEDSLSLHDLVKSAVNKQRRTIIFLDELHALRRGVGNALLSALDPGILVTKVKKGRRTLMYRYPIPDTVSFAGATTERGMIFKPLQTRFQLVEMEDYSETEKATIVEQYLGRTNTSITDDAKLAFGRISRSIRHLTQLADIAKIQCPNIDMDQFRKICAAIQVNEDGLTKKDVKLLEYLSEHEAVSMRDLCAYLEVETAEYINNIEPFLSKGGFIEVSQRGRKITDKGLASIGRERKILDIDILGELVNE